MVFSCVSFFFKPTGFSFFLSEGGKGCVNGKQPTLKIFPSLASGFLYLGIWGLGWVVGVGVCVCVCGFVWVSD